MNLIQFLKEIKKRGGKPFVIFLKNPRSTNSIWKNGIFVHDVGITRFSVMDDKSSTEIHNEKILNAQVLDLSRSSLKINTSGILTVSISW